MDGYGQFAKQRRVGAFAQVSLSLEPSDGPDTTVTFQCSGHGYEAQGHLFELPAEGYDEWKDDARAGVRFALEAIQAGPHDVVITKIGALMTDTTGAVVGAAASLAVIDGLKAQVDQEFHLLLERNVFRASAGLHDRFATEGPMDQDRKYKVFYDLQSSPPEVPSSFPVSMSLVTVLNDLLPQLHEHDDFIGLVDDEGGCFQVRVAGLYLLDVPVPAREGSLTREVEELSEVRARLKTLPQRITDEAFPDFHFQPWPPPESARKPWWKFW